MANFKIGDKVRIIILEDEDITGIIVAKGDIPSVKERVLYPKVNSAGETSWWKVKLDGTGEEKDFPDDKIKNIE